MFKGFKDFVLRGNVLELAVAVAIGGAFTVLVGAMGDNLITPLVNRFLALLGLDGAAGAGTISIGAGQVINLGAIFTAVVVFVVTAAVIYYLIVVPMNTMQSRLTKAKDEEAEEPSDEVVLLREIRDALTARDS